MIMGTSIRRGKLRENIKILAKESIRLCESKSYKPWFDEECLKLVDRRKNMRDLYRGITEFKKGYQPKTNLVKDERGDHLADHKKILTRCKNYFGQLLNVQGPGSIRQTEIHTHSRAICVRV
jgi:hypothetical protein